jgi:L-seryl-tRNA(Ser) seleniumtransferase
MVRQTPKVYKRLGVKPIIHAAGTTTLYSGTRMPPEVLRAMEEASRVFVHMGELNRKASDAIARLTGAEAGMVTSGSAAGLVLQAAACIAGTDPARIRHLPDSTGMRNEIIIHRAHRIQYDQAYTIGGGRLVEIGNTRTSQAWELEVAISERTAAVAYIVTPLTSRRILTLEQVVEISHRYNLPVIVDAASTLPPRENLYRYTRAGADMVIYSGGKGIRGPQSTGLLVGRKHLIEAALANASPNASVGRPMKVSKEEIIGLLTALEMFVKGDEEAEMTQWRVQMQRMADTLSDIKGIRATVELDDYDHWIPHAVIQFDNSWKGPRGQQVMQMLAEGDPPIYLYPVTWGDEVIVDPFNLSDEEVELVARRLREVLEPT